MCQGNAVLITGGATGIGYALAQAFLANGSKVLICGRREDQLRSARAQHHDLRTRVCDVAEDQDRQSLADWIAEQAPGLNILVNNAGVQRDVDFTQGIGAFQSGDNEIRINLEATIFLTGMFVPLLAKNPQPAIINVSSGLGFVPSVRMPVYSASKAGVHAFSMAVREQLSKIGINVYEVVPPAVDTDLNPAGRAKRGRAFKAGLGPTEFVAAVMKALQADVLEIGFGTTANLAKASRADLDRGFKEMNRHM